MKKIYSLLLITLLFLPFHVSAINQKLSSTDEDGFIAYETDSKLNEKKEGNINKNIHFYIIGIIVIIILGQDIIKRIMKYKAHDGKIETE